MTTAQNDPRSDESIGGLLGKARTRIGQGELGPLPVILGIIGIWTIFYIANPNFLSPANLTNMMLQIAAVGTISVGIVMVLLLGEIDLSVGSVSGFAGAVTGVLSAQMGVSAALAITAGILVGVGVGLFNGLVVTRFRVHSLVVTLAGLLGWQGAQLYVLGDTGSINLSNPSITGLAGTFFPPLVGWIAAVLVVVAFAAFALSSRRAAISEGLEKPLLPIVAQIILVAVAMFAAVAVLNADRGLPLAIAIFLFIVIAFHLMTRKTRFGRYLYAVGGGEEAARRAGIDVNKVKVAAFVLCSTLAAFGGILAASRLLAVNQASGGGDILLNAIAGPVIAGTSLMGGRGSVWSALLGALVIGSISNGMDLLALDSSVKFMITGAVLLVAASIDATASRRRQVTGRG